MADPTEISAMALAHDDIVIVFRTEKSDIRGRLVRLAATSDTVLSRHNMPDPVSHALGQSLALAAMLGSVLPADGKIILQTRTSGPVSFLVADYDAPGRVRGHARFDGASLSAMMASSQTVDTGDVLGEGHLAITVDQGLGSDRYQGVIALDGVPLELAAAAYFEQREALPTFVRLAVARHGKRGSEPAWRWRAGGLMMQSIADVHETEDMTDSDSAEHWSRVRTLAATVEDHELLDPNLSAERLLLRLFHEEGVRVERVLPLTSYCRCSRERVFDVLRSFGAKELADMRDDAGDVVVTCEFCASHYRFGLSEIERDEN